MPFINIIMIPNIVYFRLQIYFISIIVIVIVYYSLCLHNLFREGWHGTGQSLRRGFSGYRGHAVLLEVGGHGRVAAQSLTRAFQTPVPLHDPGAAVRLLTQHATALLGGNS